jgi:hypothetical protein
MGGGGGGGALDVRGALSLPLPDRFPNMID